MSRPLPVSESTSLKNWSPPDIPTFSYSPQARTMRSATFISSLRIFAEAL
jgi:hypothetical protein